MSSQPKVQRALDRLPKNVAGGLNRPPLLLFGLGLVLVVDLEEVLLYNTSNEGLSRGFPLKQILAS